MTARKARVTRAVFGVFILGIAAFTVSSVVQVARPLFFSETTGEEAPRVGPACAEVIGGTVRAIEAARIAAVEAEDQASRSGSAGGKGEIARVRYREERNRTQASDPAAICASDPHGPDAIAALVRLDRAAESHAIREARELVSVRRAVQSFIRGPR